MNILVTGATGFVGTEVVHRLLKDGHAVRSAVRTEPEDPSSLDRVRIGDLTPETDWGLALVGVESVVHLAGRAHVRRDTAPGEREEFRRVNSLATLNLARQTARAGAKRLVFVSSIKARTGDGEPLTPYGASKREAEEGLRALASETGLEVTIIRPPLVYGPGVKANFRALMRAVELGIPLPLGAVDNRRSLLALDNLVDFIVTCIHHPAAANETFEVSDGEDLSTAELIRRLAAAMGRPARLVSVPPSVLRTVGKGLRRRATVERLLGSLLVDSSRARALLGWMPPVSVDEGLSRTVGRTPPGSRTRMSGST